jgi:hypothetical protein
MNRLTPVALCSALLLVPTAPAGAADGARPIKLGGMIVTWPILKTAGLVVTAPIKVPVRPGKGTPKGTRATFVFARLAIDDQTHKLIKRQTLRHGTFKVRVPQAGAATYRLTVSVGRERRTFDAVVNHGLDECGPRLGRPTGDVQVNKKKARTGTRVKIVIHNHSRNCLTYAPIQLAWQRKSSKGWVTKAKGPQQDTLVAPRGQLTIDALVPRKLRSGRYRLLARLPRVGGDAVPDLHWVMRATTRLTVTR